MWGQRLTQLSDDQRSEAAALRKTGLSLKVIARRYGVSITQLFRALKPGNPQIHGLSVKHNRCRSSEAQFKRHKWTIP